MTKNNLDTLLATPIPLTINYEGEKITLNFKRMTIGIRAALEKRFGRKELYESLTNFDETVVMPFLYCLLSSEERSKLDGLKDKLFIEDENGEKIFLASNTYEVFKNIFGYQIETCYNLILEVSGLDHNKVNEMSDTKKKEMMEQIKELTTQDSTLGLQKKQAGQ